MDNNNNEMPPVGPSAPEPQMEQPAPIPPVVEQPVVDQSVPQSAPQPMGQPMVGQVDAQPAMEQPVMGQPVGQPIVMSQPVEQPVAGAEATGAKKKKGLIIGCCIGVGVVVAALVAVFLIFFLKGGEKTVSCTMETSSMGISMKNESTIKIRDGEIYSASVISNVDLKSLSGMYKNYEEEIVNGIAENLKSQCTDHCKFNNDYVAGDHLKLMMEYDGEGIEDVVYTYGIEGKSAQEIADKVQASMEKTSGTTCKQS